MFLFFRLHQNNNNNALGSLPSIDDFSDAPIIVTQPPQAPPQSDNLSDGENRIDVMSDTSSSSSDSDSDSDGNTTAVLKSQSNGHVAAATATTNNGARANLILNEDLCLSESGSDSD